MPNQKWMPIHPADSRFTREEPLVAGYVLTDYIDADTEDCSPIIQMLMDHLAAVGGGSLYAKQASDVYVIHVASFNIYNGICLDGCDRH